MITVSDKLYIFFIDVGDVSLFGNNITGTFLQHFIKNFYREFF